MSRIEGSSRAAWPPLRISYAEGVRPAAAQVQAQEPAATVELTSGADRAADLAMALDTRLSRKLDQIRADVYGTKAPDSYGSASEPAARPTRRLDVLA